MAGGNDDGGHGLGVERGSERVANEGGKTGIMINMARKKTGQTVEVVGVALGRGQSARLAALGARLGIGSRSKLLREAAELLLARYERRPEARGAQDGVADERAAAAGGGRLSPKDANARG